MDLVIALVIPVVLLLGLTIVFVSDGVPPWVYSLNSRKTWLYGVIGLSTVSLLVALFRS